MCCSWKSTFMCLAPRNGTFDKRGSRWWASTCEVPGGEPLHARYLVVSLYMQGARWWASTCEFPGGEPLHARFQVVSLYMQGSRWWASTCEVPGGEPLHAWFQVVSLYMHGSRWWASTCMVSEIKSLCSCSLDQWPLNFVIQCRSYKKRMDSLKVRITLMN